MTSPPPPAPPAAHASSAIWKAAVSLVRPSPAAPRLRTSKRSGMPAAAAEGLVLHPQATVDASRLSRTADESCIKFPQCRFTRECGNYVALPAERKQPRQSRLPLLWLALFCLLVSCAAAPTSLGMSSYDFGSDWRL